MRLEEADANAELRTESLKCKLNVKEKKGLYFLKLKEKYGLKKKKGLKWYVRHGNGDFK